MSALNTGLYTMSSFVDAASTPVEAVLSAVNTMSSVVEAASMPMHALCSG